MSSRSSAPHALRRPAPPDHPVVAAVRDAIEAMGGTIVAAGSEERSDLPIRWAGEPIAYVRLPPLHGALDRLIEGVERDLGGRLAELTRDDKQRAVRMLDERGAFILRRAVEDVADVMGVSRITVYNYLNAIHR